MFRLEPRDPNAIDIRLWDGEAFRFGYKLHSFHRACIDYYFFIRRFISFQLFSNHLTYIAKRISIHYNVMLHIHTTFSYIEIITSEISNYIKNEKDELLYRI